jgi:ethanolamine-phosphate cytidylyltransferase
MAESKKQVRVWADGCFDMVHWGHANAIRQAASTGDYLIMGVHSDAEIRKNKGPPVMNEEERYRAVEACRWVNEVVRDAPYTTSIKVMDEYKADFCVHGDDLVLAADGKDSYHEVKAANRFVTVPRTEGVSTTQLVSRMLKLTAPTVPETATSLSASPYTGASGVFASSRRISQFANNKDPKPTDVIVYVNGAFDLFHVGHIDFLEKARALGDYLVVGIHDDEVVNKRKGSSWPILTLYERALSLLSCRYVDEVIFGAPLEVTEELIRQYRIGIVAAGTVRDPAPLEAPDAQEARYSVAKARGIFKLIESPRDLTATKVVDRVLADRAMYEERNRKKEAKELASLSV